MLTYSPPAIDVPQQTRDKPWLLLLLVFMWIWPGIFARDLWGLNESRLFAYIEAMAKSHDWLLPKIYDIPFLSSSPLYLWLGYLAKTFFGALGFSDYTSIRLLTSLLMIASFVFIGLGGFNFIGRRFGRIVVLVLIGCGGIIIFGHQISQLPLLFLALALYCYGISRFWQHQTFFVGGILALSWILSFYSANFLPVILLVLLSLGLLFHPAWRTRQYVLVLFIAAVIFLPIAFLWPNALMIADPGAYHTWLSEEAFGFKHSWGATLLSFPASLLYYLRYTLWYAFPAWPLALWTLYKVKKKIIQDPFIFFFVLWIVLGLLLLALQGKNDNDGLILIILPLSYLAAYQIDTLKRGFASFLNWFGIATFGFFAVFIWFEYVLINFKISNTLVQSSFYFNPYYEPHISLPAIIAALTFTPIWLYVVLRSRIKGRQAVTNWATGMTFIWLLMMTLFLPWINSSKSYQPLVAEFEETLPFITQKELNHSSTCINSDSLETLIAWNESGTYEAYPDFGRFKKNCAYHLTLATLQDFKNKHPNNRVIWSGTRIREKSRTFILWQ